MGSSSRPARRRLPFAPAHHCRSCGADIDAFQAVGQAGVCERFECRAAESRRRQAEDRAIEAGRRERARTRLEADGADPGVVSWSVTPFNGAEVVPLTQERRAAFLDYLRRTVAEAVEGGDAGSDAGSGAGSGGASGADSDPNEGRFGPPGPGEARALAAGCGTCRGWCCRQGGTHAFLTAERIARLLRERPELHPDGVPALYASHLEETHLEGGCVFQGETGCRLPRDVRGDTCNDYFCPDLVEVRRRWRKEEPSEGDGNGSTKEGGDGSDAPTHHFVAVTPRGDAAQAVGRTAVPEEV